jgi:cytochrome c1
MIRRALLATLCALFADLAVAGEQRTYDTGRGELLYSTHCIACHSTQVHWRDKKLVTDWSRLLSEVRHWEGFSRLEWTEDDVAAVARHLNAMYYHFTVPE